MKTFKQMFEEELCKIAERFPHIIELVQYAREQDDEILRNLALSLTDLRDGECRKQVFEDIRNWIPTKEMTKKLDEILAGVEKEIIW